MSFKDLDCDVRNHILHFYERLRTEELIRIWKTRLINVEQIDLLGCPTSKKGTKIDYLWKDRTSIFETSFYVNNKAARIDMKPIYALDIHIGILRVPTNRMTYTFRKYLEDT